MVRHMAKKQSDIRDLRVDVFMGDKGRSYRVTHIPSGVFIESESVADAITAINRGLEGEA